MENLLEKVAGMLGGLWDWTVHLNGGLQIVLVLLAVVMSGVCAIVDWQRCVGQVLRGRVPVR